MRKSDLVSKVACVTKCTKKEADLIITAVLEVIIEAVASGEKVTLIGFGSFFCREIAGRHYLHPKTKEKGVSPPFKKPIFSVGKFFKNKVNTLH
jgi:DNA-binding protein HU-beta